MTDDIEEHRRNLAEANARLRTLTAGRGFAYQIAEGDPNTPPYLHTVGLKDRFGHPEIYVLGLQPSAAAVIVEAVVDRILGGERFDRPCFVSGIIPYEMPFMPISGLSGTIPPGEAVQLFIPDGEGRVPWEPDCDADFGGAQTALFKVVGDYPARNVPLGGRPPDGEIAKRMRKGVEILREQVEANGFTFQPVFARAEEEGQSFVYTIGLSKTFGHPEMYVVGLQVDDAINLLRNAIEKISEGESFKTPTFFTDEDGDVVPVRPLLQEDVDENSGIGQQVLGTSFPAVQAYYPDKDGLFPWEAGCDPEYQAQLSVLRAVGDPPVLPDIPGAMSIH